MLKRPVIQEKKKEIDDAYAYDLFKEFEKSYILFLAEKHVSERLRSDNEEKMTEWTQEGINKRFGTDVTYYGDIKDGREDEEDDFLKYHFSRPYNNEIGLADSHWKLF